ncbi:MAG: N-acetylmuramic acid 6-phosphate etherase [Deinococcus sp.]
MLDTEGLNDRYHDLDTLETGALVHVLLEDQARAASAVLSAQRELAEAVDAAAERLARGGRLVYLGAGTSGRLAALDAAELPPTFSWPTSRAVALLAGGEGAMWQAREGAEDDATSAEAELRALGLGPDDVLIAVAASGTTPYAVGGVTYGRSVGALTLGFANNPGAPLLAAAELAICLPTGAEVIGGSTRLKAGTAQKIALSTFSSALMVRLGKVYGNLMVDLRATNLKLKGRAVRVVMGAAEVGEDVARLALEESGYRPAVAIVSLRRGVSAEEAGRLLDAADGHVRAALTVE